MRHAPARREVLLLLNTAQQDEGFAVGLAARVLYGCGLRVSEPLELRVKDVDLASMHLSIRAAKGGKDRIVPIPCSAATRAAVVIIDPAGTYCVRPLLDFREAKALRVQQAELVTLAFLHRNPNGFDDPDLLRQMFLKPALQQAQEEQTREAVEFRAKQLHQKPEIARIDILAVRQDEVLTRVTGQIIRAGIFEDKTFSEGFNFKLSLRLLRNPNMLANGRFPTGVASFKYQTWN